MERLEYIDILKGIAIILVVIGHLMSFSFGDNIIYTYIYVFHMPLFMFLSGYVMSENQDGRKLRSKITRLLVPGTIIGLSFTYCEGNDIYYFIKDTFKSGYWYLYSLSVFYVLFYFIDYLSSLCNRKKSFMFLGALLVSVFLVIFDKSLNESLGGVISSDKLSHLWPYFIVGFFVKKGYLDKILNSSNIISGLMVIWVLIYLLLFHFYDFDHTSLVAPIIVLLIFTIVKEICFNDILKNVLIYFGMNSLHIYVWHYFFVSSIELHFVGDWINQSSNYLLGLCIYTIFSFFIGYICVAIGKFITHNRLLSLLIYGHKHN